MNHTVVGDLRGKIPADVGSIKVLLSRQSITDLYDDDGDVYFFFFYLFLFFLKAIWKSGTESPPGIVGGSSFLLLWKNRNSVTRLINAWMKQKKNG